MTQSPRPVVSLTATSTELPVAWDVMPVGAEQQQPATAIRYLVLFPGKPGEIILRTRNNGEQSIHLRLEVGGTFPPEWLSDTRWARLEGQERWTLPLGTLEPRTSRSETLAFQVGDDFFEQQQALVQRNRLELSYQSILYLYGSLAEQQTERLVGYQVVDCYIRPITNYLNFLPEIYQQSDFLGRFLSIFEQAFDPTMQTLDNFWAYLDPLTAPKSLLPFLAEWVAWPMNPNWPLKQQRKLIRYAVEIYQWRGTRRGLQLALSLVTGLPEDDQHIDIAEEAQTDFVLGRITLADTPSLGGGRAFHFSVVLRPDSADQRVQLDETIIRAIIEQEKPAFCTYDLEIALLTV